MTSEDAQKRLCPFRFGRPQESDQIGDLKHVDYEDQHCVTHKCMAWELIEITGHFEGEGKDQKVVTSDQGYCALIRQEAVEGFVMPYMKKTRAW